MNAGLDISVEVICAQYEVWLSYLTPSNCANTTSICPYNAASPFPGLSCNSIGNVESIELKYDYSFSGSIVSSINQLTALTSLQLGGYSLTGTLPESLFQIASLVRLQISYNKFRGTLPLNVNMPSIVGINLAHNSLTGTIPNALFDLSNLESLDLSFNQFTGYMPSSIGNLQSLLALNIEYNSLIGNIPLEICKLTLLEGLYICTSNQHYANLNFFYNPSYYYTSQYSYANENDNGCPFLQGVPKCIIEAPSSNLSRLTVASEGLGQLIPLSLQQGTSASRKKETLMIILLGAICDLFADLNVPCPPIEGICGSNYFRTYVQCDSRFYVVGLNVSSLGLVGDLPPSFALLTTLTYLNLSDNLYSGPFPEYIANFSQLQILALCLPDNSNCSFSNIPLPVADAPFGGPLSLLTNKTLGNLTSLEKGTALSYDNILL